MGKLLLILALGLTGLVLLPVASTRADEGAIEVMSTSAESQFPDGIKFSITVRSEVEIEDIRVFFTKAGQTGISAYRAVDFEPGTLVNGESVLSSRGSDYFPPGTRMKFSFQIWDKAGAMVRTPEEDFTYIDNRFEWRTVNSGLITAYYYGEYVEERAKTVLEAAEGALERMAPVLGIEPTKPLQIVSYNNYRHMSMALPFTSQTTRERLRTQGMAFSDERVLLVHGFDATVRGTTSHEFTHLLVAEAAGRASAQVPAWLNEGLAEYGNLDPTDDYPAALRYGIFTRRLKPLWYQDSFSGTPDDIIIAYGQGRSVVFYMINRYGPEKMAQLFQVLQKTLDIDAALQEVYGLDQYGLDTEWRLAIGIEPLPPPEDLERRVQKAGTPEAESPGPAGPDPETPEPTAESAPPGEEQVKDAGPAASEVQGPPSEPGPAPSAEDRGERPSSPGGCSSPVLGESRAALGLGSLLLLGAAVGLMWRRALRPINEPWD